MYDTTIENQDLNVNSEHKKNTIIRVVHNRENPFVQLNKQAVWDKNLSLKAVGLWARCMCRPNDWTFSIKELASHSKEGRRAIDSAMQELIEQNYACRLEYHKKDENGKFMKGMGGIEYVFFEFPATDEEKQEQLEIFKKSFQRCGFGDSRFSDSRKCTLLIKTLKETDVTEKDLTPPTPPQKTMEADASGAVACQSPKSKSKKEKPTFSALVMEVANKMIDLLKKYTPVYRPPSDLNQFLLHVQDLIEKDKQDPNVVLKTFEWGLSDNEKRGDFTGWQGIISTNMKGRKPTTPAEVLRNHFTKIHSQMGSKPKRKFGASSDSEAALECMREMNSRAI